jgi:DNA polymerase-1
MPLLSPPRADNTLLLIDGYGFVFRAFYALPPLTDPSGAPVGAVYGFLKMVLKLIREQPVTHIAVVLDHGEKTFRNTLYDGYKAHRPPAPEEICVQFPLIRETCAALRLAVRDIPGYEADDVIASLASRAVQAGMQVRIVSADKDLMQLVTDDVLMLDPVKNITLDREAVRAKTGVYPERVRDFLALTGDASDNVPGVPGVGPKTAVALLEEFGSLEGVLANGANIPQAKRRETLLAHREDALLSYQLVGLDRNADTDVPLSDFAFRPFDPGVLLAFAEKYGFRAIVKELSLAPRQLSLDAPTLDARVCADAREMTDAIEKGRRAEGPCACHLLPCEADGRRLFIAAYAHGDEACVWTGETQEDIRAVCRSVADALEDPYRLSVAADAKYLLNVLHEHGVSCVPRTFDDVETLSYLAADAVKHDIAAIAASCGMTLSPPGKNASPEETAVYAASLVRAVLRAFPGLKRRVEQEKSARVYYRIERPLLPVVAEMERTGIMIDRTRMAALSAEFAARIAELEGKIYREAGREFAVGSPKQLGEILFDTLGLKRGRKSGKSGQSSTDADVLEELAAQGATIARDVLDWRHYSKLKSTYTDVLPLMADKDGRLHTLFSMTATSTGRLSSSKPNLQNIPVRTEDGSAIRSAFIARPGHVLVSADYSQIELRLLAHAANVPRLKQAFLRGEDVHAATAAEMFGLLPGTVPPDLRRQAKTVNFGIIYGISAYGLATRLRIPSAEAKAMIERYFARYPEIRAYMDACVASARENGHVRTLWGRKCPTRDIKSSNHAVRQFAERAAVNAPLQGSAADLVKKAMLAADRFIQNAEGARMVLQIHDELLFEVEEDKAETFGKRIKRAMEEAASLSVPLEANVGIGRNWQEAH